MNRQPVFDSEGSELSICDHVGPEIVATDQAQTPPFASQHAFALDRGLGALVRR